LETARLRLRRYGPDDADDLFEILGDPETMRYYPEPYSREGTLRWIEDNMRRYELDGFELWAMEMMRRVASSGTAVRPFARSTGNERSRSAGT